MIPAGATSLDHARRLHRLGLSVIPVPRAGGRLDGKIPVLPWKEYQTRLPTDDELVQLFGTNLATNYAIVTGSVSDLVVVDADSPEARRWCVKRLPYTPWQCKTSLGYHLYYRHPGVPVRNRARIQTQDGRLAIDVRGDGGYVIAPGSVHASGAVYAEAGDWTAPRSDVPRFWPGWLARPHQTPVMTVTRSRPSGGVVTRARKYLAAIPRPEIGNGSDVATLSAACRLVRGFELAPADAETLLWEWTGGRPGFTPDWIAAKVAHALRYGSEPVGGLR